MEAMTMPFSVNDAKVLDGLAPGVMIDFTLVVDKKSSYAEEIRVRPYHSTDREPLEVSRLKVLQGAIAPESTAKVLTIGQPVPNFTLTDQKRRSVSLTQFAGKVVAVNFIYTRCALPEYCYRISNNFGRIQKRFSKQLGRELVLLTITFDPVHDQPEVLAEYARIWKADPQSWRFLTGDAPEVRRVCGLFGVDFWQDEALLTHSIHTAIIDRQGKLVANLEGNQYSAEQLGDLVATVIERAN
jgi:protein SCO1/2